MVEKMLAARGVAFHNETEIVDALRDPASQQKFLVSATGVRFSYDEVVWCTEGMGQPWLASSGLAVDEDNCVLVQVTSPLSPSFTLPEFTNPSPSLAAHTGELLASRRVRGRGRLPQCPPPATQGRSLRGAGRVSPNPRRPYP